MKKSHTKWRLICKILKPLAYSERLEIFAVLDNENKSIEQLSLKSKMCQAAVVYGIGHCSVIIFAGTFTEMVQRYINWNEKSKGAIILKKVCGVLVLLGGIYLIYTAP